ncbi:MAG TPA: GH1 family beta-glucosidase [Bryobacteraceae bacterium]|nr:GH1 family beta-glucosidase [Bryobacteraceae bacterium]
MTKTVSRRLFGKAAGFSLGSAAAVGSDLAERSGGAPIGKDGADRRFPAGFQWGCATASYQVEGAVKEDGRKPSIWDTFSHTPGKVFQNETGDVADDSYHRYKEDVQLLKALGAKVYRFSISWPRVFPDGTGQPNDKGLAFYQRLTDELLANGIQPYCTLFHWDLPQALQDRFGGWQSRETSKAFAAYAGYVAGKLSDRIHHFFTTNEFVCFTDLGYKVGQFAPGLKLADAQVNQIRHHGILAHGLGVQAIRAAAKAGTQVGLAENATVYVPVIETRAHIEAAEKATRHLNAQFLTAVLEGKYLESYLKTAGAAAPKFTAEDMKAIGSPVDFIGLNVYQPDYVRATNTELGFAVVKKPSSFPRMASPWLYIGPEVIYWAVRNVSNVWKPKALYITENGCSSDDVVAADGHIYDTDRVMYLRNHLANLQRAAAEGYPVKGYFLWSLLDNFEWADGYSKRFGIHYVDFKTLKRTAKLSAEFYKAAIAANSVV